MESIQSQQEKIVQTKGGKDYFEEEKRGLKEKSVERQRCKACMYLLVEVNRYLFTCMRLIYTLWSSLISVVVGDNVD